MADRVITIAEPNAATDGVHVAIERAGGEFTIYVTYAGASAKIKEDQLTAQQRTTLSNIVSAILNRTKTALGH